MTTSLAGVLAADFALPPPGRPEDLRAGLAAALYGAVPPPPDGLSVDSLPIPGEGARRLAITLAVGGRRFAVDAALWMPEAAGPVPVICGLDFVGPAGMMFSGGFPLDPGAVVYARPEFGAGGRLGETLRGASAYRWPVPMLLRAGYAVLTSCYGSWVPDSPEAWRGHGLVPLLRAADCGAITLWAWALMRLLDVAGGLPGIDPARRIVAGHSRLGKAALWAAANDPRVAAVFANQSGCAGAAPAAHPVGETLAQMAERFPHWLRPGFDPSDPRLRDLDQHHLLSLIAPRGLYLAAAREDTWADPLGTWLCLRAAAPAWGEAAAGAWPDAAQVWADGTPRHNGRLGFHLRPGGHDLLPHDWALVLDWLAQAGV